MLGLLRWHVAGKVSLMGSDGWRSRRGLAAVESGSQPGLADGMRLQPDDCKPFLERAGERGLIRKWL